MIIGDVMEMTLMEINPVMQYTYLDTVGRQIGDIVTNYFLGSILRAKSAHTHSLTLNKQH